MPYEGADVFSCVCVPQADSSIFTAACDFFSIWAERNAIDTSCMPCDRVEHFYFSRVHIPNFDGAEVTTPCDFFPIWAECYTTDQIVIPVQC